MQDEFVFESSAVTGCSGSCEMCVHKESCYVEEAPDEAEGEAWDSEQYEIMDSEELSSYERQEQEFWNEVADNYNKVSRYSGESFVDALSKGGTVAVTRAAVILRASPRWTDLLKMCMQESRKKKKTFATPNTRWLDPDIYYQGALYRSSSGEASKIGLYVPGYKDKKKKDKIKDIVFAIDCSGSMDSTQLAQIAGHILIMMNDLSTNGYEYNAWVVYWGSSILFNTNDEVQDFKTPLYQPEQFVKEGGSPIAPPDGGGTDPLPVFTWLIATLTGKFLGGNSDEEVPEGYTANPNLLGLDFDTFDARPITFGREAVRPHSCADMINPSALIFVTDGYIGSNAYEEIFKDGNMNAALLEVGFDPSKIFWLIASSGEESADTDYQNFVTNVQHVHDEPIIYGKTNCGIIAQWNKV